MGTRSTIAIERADGTIAQVYCHWDGYLDHNGRILQEHYNTVDKIEQLIKLGNISSLGKEIGKKHPFDPGWGERDPVKKAKIEAAHEAADKAGWTTFYGRDRGETGKGVRAAIYSCLADYNLSNNKEEYDYLFRNGTWTVRCDSGTHDLAEALAHEAKESK